MLSLKTGYISLQVYALVTFARWWRLCVGGVCTVNIIQGQAQRPNCMADDQWNWYRSLLTSRQSNNRLHKSESLLQSLDHSNEILTTSTPIVNSRHSGCNDRLYAFSLSIHQGVRREYVHQRSYYYSSVEVSSRDLHCCIVFSYCYCSNTWWWIHLLFMLEQFVAKCSH